jgi:glycosyltransferase involved in cell wall biosynthesis
VQDCWLIVPLYNEGLVVGDVLREVRRHFPWIVCVDDGSTDDSAAAAEAAGAVVVRHPVNLGQGAAIQTGLAYALRDAQANFFVTFDSDGQHRVEDALAMVSLLRDGSVDVVFGSRFLDDRTRPSFLKRLVLKAAIAYTNATTGMHLTDAHNGLRAFNRKAASVIDIHQNRMAHASEIVEQVAKSGVRWQEAPVHIVYSEYSRAKGQSLWNSVNILSELFLK